ncbi:unnamed protein product [Dicrocoelium dendriticum]|nr:unnamed protein product [Dicrocoelium dendriticum]
MFLRKPCVLLVGLLISWVTGLDKVRLNENGEFVDDTDRILLFHGFNSVVKHPPWYDEQLTNRTQLKMFQSWGINFVRLGVMWSGVMPKEGQIEEEYLKKISDIIRVCAEHGIYVLIDLHQDLLSSRFGGYDGIPLWLVDKMIRTPTNRRYPWPFSRPPEFWFENYLTYACVDCADRLYKNHSGSWVHWGDFWQVVASRLGRSSNVIGYELLNEPPPANFYDDPRNALPGYVGHRLLLPAYDYLVQRIREVDNETLIFYEPLTYGVFLPPSLFDTGTGFDRVPGSRNDPNASGKSVLSYHYYCWLLQKTDPRATMNLAQKVICDSMLLPSVFKNSRNSIRRTGGGRFLTEFGLCGADGNPASINTIECNAVMNKADENFQSWAYWDGNFLDAHGNPIESQVMQLQHQTQ